MSASGSGQLDSDGGGGGGSDVDDATQRDRRLVERVVGGLRSTAGRIGRAGRETVVGAARRAGRAGGEILDEVGTIRDDGLRRGTGEPTDPATGGLPSDGGPTAGEPTVAEPGEQFGDIVVSNPLTGNRLESDLETAAGGIDTVIEGAARQRAAGVGGVPAGTGPIDTALQLSATERTLLRAGEGVGLDREVEAIRGVTPGRAGPVQSGTAALLAGGGQVLNPASLALDVKEATEFAATQPQRVAGPGAVDVTTGGVTLAAGEPTAAAATVGGALVSDEPILDEESDDFAADVVERGGATVEATTERVAADPIGTAAGGAGALLTGSALGRGAGSTLLRSARAANNADVDVRAEVDDFASDTRGQVSGGRLVDEVDVDPDPVDTDTTDVDPDPVDRGDRVVLSESPRDLMSGEIFDRSLAARRQLSPDEAPRSDPLAGGGDAPTFDPDVVDAARRQADEAMAGERPPLSQRFDSDEPIEADVSAADDVAMVADVVADAVGAGAGAAAAGLDDALARRDEAMMATVEIADDGPPGVKENTSVDAAGANTDPQVGSVDEQVPAVDVVGLGAGGDGRGDADVDVGPDVDVDTDSQTDVDADVRTRADADPDPDADVDPVGRPPVDVDPLADPDADPDPDPGPRRPRRDDERELDVLVDEEGRDDERRSPFDLRFTFDFDVPTLDDLTTELATDPVEADVSGVDVEVDND